MAHCTVATADSLRESGASKRHAFNQIINRFQIGVWESEIACSNTVLVPSDLNHSNIFRTKFLQQPRMHERNALIYNFPLIFTLDGASISHTNDGDKKTTINGSSQRFIGQSKIT